MDDQIKEEKCLQAAVSLKEHMSEVLLYHAHILTQVVILLESTSKKDLVSYERNCVDLKAEYIKKNGNSNIIRRSLKMTFVEM